MGNYIINEKKILNTIEQAAAPDKIRLRDILDKAIENNELDATEIAGLLNIDDQDSLAELFNAANKIKNEIYGKRLVLFAPLYVSNYCANNCLYCGFRAANSKAERKVLTLEEVRSETEAILEQGHKRVLMLMGEDSEKCGFDYFLKTIDAVYSAKDSRGGSIRRVNLEIAPLTREEFKRLREVQIGTYTVFQETYHRETYKRMHPAGRKADFDARLETIDLALESGLGDVGIGALFGLFDYRFETLAMIEHARALDRRFGIGPHTISIPRIKPAENAPVSTKAPAPVSDVDFKKLVAVLRIAVPYTGVILSTREPAWLRRELFELGVSQISAGSRTSPGGYKRAFERRGDDEQFSLNDCRSSGEVIEDVIELGYIPSFCTACYRLGRVGGDFMDLAKPGLIKLNCHPNALLTLKEYLLDYASESVRAKGDALIEKELAEIPAKARRAKTEEYLSRLEAGERDLYF